MPAKDDSEKGMNRRSLLRHLATGVAGAVAAPHAASIATGRPAPSQAPADVGTSLAALNEHDHELLVSLCDILVPGSVEAGVPGLMERVVAVETPEIRRALLAALRAFEGEARAKYESSWVGLDEASRNAILIAAASGSPEELYRHFVQLRDGVSETYFATERGMRKLGWTPRNAWRELPRCEHSGDDHGRA